MALGACQSTEAATEGAETVEEHMVWRQHGDDARQQKKEKKKKKKDAKNKIKIVRGKKTFGKYCVIFFFR